MYKTCYLGLRVTDFLKKGYVGGGVVEKVLLFHFKFCSPTQLEKIKRVSKVSSSC